ncbi:hypothetical protein [Chromohalobacter canadensis]|uniref:YfhG lipoprotein n=1 Tax=Chromohalobacter canadensis TaxID=141389 RepID=A0A285VRS4_9GAMM|nr:hypothetical protein [Chromohalobacter canadensis]MCK0768837.1 hypothetical protein [Chromohalobacter canadensis]WQH08013.1 hypothetical protein SR908_11005 [Chromohalobacter canadensis]SOC56784.1 hypothetical protein SAMN05421509_107256 [Chromohalobacter canadensis]
MNIRMLLVALCAGSLLTGCQWMTQETSAPAAPVTSCNDDIPKLADNVCLVDDWIDFGLASQRGDSEWRDTMLTRLQGDMPHLKLARAVVLAWGERDGWEQASELYKADISAAPSRLQPLLRQWLNELEARRDLASDLAKSESRRQALGRERDDLAEKLDALTAIEQSINSRHEQSP